MLMDVLPLVMMREIFIQSKETSQFPNRTLSKHWKIMALNSTLNSKSGSAAVLQKNSGQTFCMLVMVQIMVLMAIGFQQFGFKMPNTSIFVQLLMIMLITTLTITLNWIKIIRLLFPNNTTIKPNWSTKYFSMAKKYILLLIRTGKPLTMLHSIWVILGTHLSKTLVKSGILLFFLVSFWIYSQNFYCA